MTIAPNRIRDALARGRPAWGTWVQTRSAEACDAAGATGYDFVVIDLQHGALDLADAASMIRAVTGRGASPVVRLPTCSPDLVGRLLDAGAHGVLVPDLRSAAEARAVVEAARYAPAGRRGACPTTGATAHGAIPWADYRAWADAHVMVWGLIETPEAIADLPAIAASGLDALMLGPFDLSLALGHGGQVDHPAVEEALTNAIAAARAAGIECVAVLFDETAGIAASAARWLARGCRIVTGASDRWCLTRGWAATFEGLRAAEDVAKTPIG